jgi:hypothetical protein
MLSFCNAGRSQALRPDRLDQATDGVIETMRVKVFWGIPRGLDALKWPI